MKFKKFSQYLILSDNVIASKTKTVNKDRNYDFKNLFSH